MKQLLIFISFSLLPALSYAQGSNAYRTVEDLLADRPAEEIPPTFRYERQRHQGKLRGEKVAAYRFKGPKEYKFSKERTFAVYMDGSLFVNPDRPKLKQRTDFYKVEWIGEYGYFVDIHEYPIWIEQTYIEDTILKEMVLDRSTGKLIELNKRNLRTILQDRPMLLMEFDSEKRKKRKLKEYLERYTKEPDDIPTEQRS